MASRAYCRSCGAEILWIITGAGKRMPLDVRSVERRFVVDGSTEPMGAEMRNTYVSHFATCANADQHRKGKTP